MMDSYSSSLLRPTDYSVRSILSTPTRHPPHQPQQPPLTSSAPSSINYLRAMGAMGERTPFPSSILSKLQQTVAGRTPIETARDVILPHGARAAGCLRLGQYECQSDSSTAPRDCPKVELEYKELWNQFDVLGTEMVITKSGR